MDLPPKNEDFTAMPGSISKGNCTPLLNVALIALSEGSKLDLTRILGKFWFGQGRDAD
jgi:hypothetical protein